MSPLKAMGLLATSVALWSLGTASAQTPGEAGATGPDYVLAYEASGGFAGIHDELLVQSDGRVFASRYLLGKYEARWATLAPAEVTSLNQAVKELFPVPESLKPPGGTMVWVVRREAQGVVQEFRTFETSGYGAQVIQWMGTLHQTVLSGLLPPPPGELGEATKGVAPYHRVFGIAGPAVAPVGSTIQIAIANDSTEVITLSCPCPFRITDAVGNLVFAPISPTVLVDVNPGEVHRMTWDQVDDLGQPVPEGDYRVEFLNIPLAPVPIAIDPAVEMGLFMVGPPRIGMERSLFLTSPGDPGRVYIAAASVSADVGIMTCEGLFPLDHSYLLDFSIRPANGVFLDFIGNLDGKGETLAPSLRLPDSQSLVGLTWHLAFVSIEFDGWCPLKRLSPALEVTILD